jgi:hypothetical protein
VKIVSRTVILEKRLALGAITLAPVPIRLLTRLAVGSAKQAFMRLSRSAIWALVPDAGRLAAVMVLPPTAVGVIPFATRMLTSNIE